MVEHAPKRNDGYRCYRLRRFYLIVGIACTAFFSVVGVVSTLAAWLNIDGSFPNPRQAALIFAVFWSGFVLLGVYLIIAGVRGKLMVDDEHITTVGAFRTSTVRCDNVMQLRWRTYPAGGGVVIRDGQGKIKIELGSYSCVERDELIHWLRERFDASLHEKWEQFQASPAHQVFSREGDDEAV